jgi:hypothetical protein
MRKTVETSLPPTWLGDDVKSWDWLADFYRRGGDTLGMERAQRQGK